MQKTSIIKLSPEMNVGLKKIRRDVLAIEKWGKTKYTESKTLRKSVNLYEHKKNGLKRYTAIFENHMGLVMSENPLSPMGVYESHMQIRKPTNSIKINVMQAPREVRKAIKIFMNQGGKL